jgi:hypothetical protein
MFKVDPVRLFLLRPAKLIVECLKLTLFACSSLASFAGLCRAARARASQS